MRRLSALLVLAALLAACSSPPATIPLLLEAQDAYSAAAARPEVTGTASDYLDEAQANIAEAERLRLAKADPQLVTHYAYLARQQVRIAEESAMLAAAEAEIESAEAERRAVQLEARTAEAEAAQRRAQRAQAEAEAARAVAAAERAEAENARAQAERARREANQARSEAEQARLDAERARAEAEEALRRAQELANRVSELEAAQTERGLVLTLGDVLFDVGKSELKAGGLRAVDELATFLGEYPERVVLIEGFTDSSGSDETNLALSQRRADAVQAALVDRGVAVERIQTIGYGEDYPKASNDSPAGRQLNRRVEVVISDDSGIIPERTE
ncbi:MAG: OmpA family protein [Bacteroidota bacterium]